VNTSDQGVGGRIDFGAFLTASAIAGAVVLVLGVIAFVHPISRTSPSTTGYTQQVTFGYGASAPTGPVYATGTVHTGFQFGGAQLLPRAASNAAGASPTTSSSTTSVTAASRTASRTRAVGTPGTAPATIAARGVSVKVSLLRLIAIIGLLLSAVAAAYFYLRKRSEPFEESVRIQSQHGHMIVSIVGGEDLGWPPVDVPSIKRWSCSPRAVSG
jgi:hypothetical protein